MSGQQQTLLLVQVACTTLLSRQMKASSSPMWSWIASTALHLMTSQLQYPPSQVNSQTGRRAASSRLCMLVDKQMPLARDMSAMCRLIQILSLLSWGFLIIGVLATVRAANEIQAHDLSSLLLHHGMHSEPCKCRSSTAEETADREDYQMMHIPCCSSASCPPVGSSSPVKNSTRQQVHLE